MVCGIITCKFNAGNKELWALKGKHRQNSPVFFWFKKRFRLKYLLTTLEFFRLSKKTAVLCCNRYF